MKITLLNLWEMLRTSFWFVPSLMLFFAIGLSFVMISIDNIIEAKNLRALGFLYAGGAEGARSILSTIAGSMITVAGVTFSITIVALTLTSSQFGPRLLRNFMQDTGNQIVLGTFIATFIYCLLVLRTVYGTDDHVFISGIAVTFAIILALINAGFLIYFIHHVSTSIQADKVIAEVYDELTRHINKLFPDELEHESIEKKNNEAKQEPKNDKYQHIHKITASKSGYLRSIDNDNLLKTIEEKDFCIHLLFRPGEFIVKGVSLALLKSSKPIEEDDKKQMLQFFIVGTQRNPEQDLEFTINQLVEIALRAISTGVNDPFTAIACIDRLGSAICQLTDRKFPLPYQYDKKGHLRVIAKTITYEGVVNTSFNQIRQDSSTSVAVTIRLLESLKTIAGRVRNSEQRQTILRQADMMIHASKDSIKDDNDKDDIQKRYQEILIVLNEIRN